MKLSTLLWLAVMSCAIVLTTLIFAFEQYSSHVSTLEALNYKKQTVNSLVNQLKASRRKLTAHARRYVITSDEYALEVYVHTLDIIQGRKARTLESLRPYLPGSLDNTVRDYVGSYLSDYDLIKKQNFTAKELALLSEIFDLSNALLSIEQQAISNQKNNQRTNQIPPATLFSTPYQDSIIAFNTFLDSYQRHNAHKISKQVNLANKDVNHLFMLVSIILLLCVSVLFAIIFVYHKKLWPLITKKHAPLLNF